MQENARISLQIKVLNGFAVAFTELHKRINHS